MSIKLVTDYGYQARLKIQTRRLVYEREGEGGNRRESERDG